MPQSWNSLSHRERSLVQTFDLIDTVSNRHNLPHHVVQSAKFFYKRIYEKVLSRGKQKTGLVAATVYMALKQADAPRSVAEISQMFDIDSPTLTRGCTRFNDVLKISFEDSSPEDYAARYCWYFFKKSTVKNKR